MIKIEIEMNTIESLATRSLLYFLSKIKEAGLTPQDKQLRNFMDKYIHSELVTKIDIADLCNGNICFTDDIIRKFESDIQKKLIILTGKEMKLLIEPNDGFKALEQEEALKQKLEALRQERETLKIKQNVNAGIYNICIFIIFIDEIIDNIGSIISSIELKEYDEASKYMRKVDEALIYVQMGITQYIIEEHYDTLVDFGKNYQLNPELYSYFKKQRGIYDALKLKEQESSDEANCLVELAILLDCIQLKKKMDIQKLEIALICIKKSPEYSKLHKELAECFLEEMRELLLGCSIEKIFIQAKQTSGDYSIRGSQDATTQLQILFECDNCDLYVLRLDFPHKGEEYIHLNLEEPYTYGMQEAAFPFSTWGEMFDEVKQLSGSYFDRLFFIRSNRVWFKSGFSSLLNEIDISLEKRNKLQEMFESRVHRKFNVCCTEDEMIDFCRKANELLQLLNLTFMSKKTLVKDGTIDAIVHNVRMRQENTLCILDLIKHSAFDLVELKNTLWKMFYKHNDFAKKMSDEELEEYDLDDIIRDIEELYK